MTVTVSLLPGAGYGLGTAALCVWVDQGAVQQYQYVTEF